MNIICMSGVDTDSNDLQLLVTRMDVTIQVCLGYRGSQRRIKGVKGPKTRNTRSG